MRPPEATTSTTPTTTNVRAHNGSRPGDLAFFRFGGAGGRTGGAAANPGRRFGRRIEGGAGREIDRAADRNCPASARRNSGLAMRAPIDDRAGLDVAPPTKNAFLYPTGAVRK